MKNNYFIEAKNECHNESNAKCPYCGHEDEDSWELDRDEECTTNTCGVCDREYDVFIQHSTTYSTSCMEDEHVYVVDDYHIQDAIKCENCGDMKFTRHGDFKVEDGKVVKNEENNPPQRPDIKN